MGPLDIRPPLNLISRQKPTRVGGFDQWSWKKSTACIRRPNTLVSWYFKPIQPQRIISGLGETFVKRKIVEWTNKAEIQTGRTEWKSRELSGEFMDWHAGEASTAVLYYVEYDTHRPTLALVRCWNLKKKKRGGGANPACIMLNVTQRGKHYHLVWCSAWLKEANAAILHEGEVGTVIQNTVVLYYDDEYDSEAYYHVVWCWIWRREANTAVLCVLNTTERQSPM